MKKFEVFLVVIIILAISFSWSMGIGNHIITLKEEVNLKQANIEAQLQRRLDLIPNLVSTAKAYAEHEEAVFTAIAEARSNLGASLESGDLEQIAKANGELDIALNQFLAISENYPELKSNEQFTALMDELAGTENRISVARQYYNEAVNKYNTYIQQYPQKIAASFLGYTQLPYFEAAEAATTAPVVNFD